MLGANLPGVPAATMRLLNGRRICAALHGNAMANPTLYGEIPTWKCGNQRFDGPVGRHTLAVSPISNVTPIDISVISLAFQFVSPSFLRAAR